MRKKCPIMVSKNDIIRDEHMVSKNDGAMKRAKPQIRLVSSCRTWRSIYLYLNPSQYKITGVIPWILRTIIFAACLYNAVMAVLVFVYTYTVPPEAGSG